MNDDEELQQIKDALAEAIARGHVEIMGYSDEGEACYRLTPAGVADVERRFGLQTKGGNTLTPEDEAELAAEAEAGFDPTRFRATEDLTLEGRAGERAAGILRRRGKTEDEELE